MMSLYFVNICSDSRPVTAWLIVVMWEIYPLVAQSILRLKLKLEALLTSIILDNFEPYRIVKWVIIPKC